MKNSSIIKASISNRLYYLLFLILSSFLIIMCSPKDPLSKYSLKLYVSTEGNDSWTGKIAQPARDKSDGPFATLEGARNAIRKLKSSNTLPKGNIIVEIQGGVYELSKPLELGQEDGGTDSRSRIIYYGQKDNEIRLSGGKYLTGWKLISDKDILEKISPDVRNKIYQTDLSRFGIEDYGTAAGGGIELFFNDKPMWISRYPNKGFIKITGIFYEDPIEIHGRKGDKAGRFQHEDSRIAAWQEEKDAWVHGYWFWDWSEQRHKISKIDAEKNIVEVAPPYHTYGYRIGQWFYGFNLLCEIDEPGEFYVDREKSILYFYPPSGVEKGQAYISLTKSIIEMNKTSFLTIQGMIFEGCRETAIKMKDCDHSSVVTCTIRNIGDWAVTINGGINNGVAGCDIYDVGAGGIRIQAGDRKTLVPGECFADNNNIHHYARLKRVYNPGISLSGVGNKASHNLIAHAPHMAINFTGNDQLIEYNEIHDVCYESNDAGAIYTGRDWTMRGNMIRYNYLYNIQGFENKGCVGVYLDDAFSSADVIGNVFNKVSRAMMIGGGRYNNVINNIFVDCIPSIHVDARAMGWMSEHPAVWLKEAEEKGTISGIEYNKPPYSTRYPELINLLTDEPKAPKGNVISNNVCFGGNWDKPSGRTGESIEAKARPYLKMENNIVAPNSGVEDSSSGSFIITDPLFVNNDKPELGKYQLDKNSPALKNGFKQIPFEKIGLYLSRERMALSD